jgi:hypothetical protein
LTIIEISWDSDNNVLDFGTKIVFGDISHFTEDHSRNLFWSENLCLTHDFNLDVWLGVLIHDFEWKIFFIVLDLFVVIFSTDQSLDVVDSVGWIDGSLVFSGFTNESFLLVEGDDGWSDSITHIVKNNINLAIFVNTDTRVGGTKINTDNWAFNLVG